MYRFLRYLPLFFLLLCASSAKAQKEVKDTVSTHVHKGVLPTITDGIVGLTDELTTTVRHTGQKIRKEVKDFNAIDTTYISPNLYNLAFMLEHSTWYEHYRLGNNNGSQPQKIGFSPTLGTKLGVYFGWRWIFLGYSFNVEDIFGGNN